MKNGDRLRSTLVPDASTAPVVKRMFDECISGKGIKEIAKGLNRDGILTNRGRRWGTNVLYQTLTNEVYRGTLVWGKRSATDSVRVEDGWPSIVDGALFDSVQLRLKARGPKLTNPRRVASEYILSGLLRCGVCGKAMNGHSAKSGRFFYYRCINAARRGPEECSGRWVPKEKLERFVVDKVRNSILTDENLGELAEIRREEMDSSIRAQSEKLEILDGQISDAEGRLEHLYDALEKGSFSQEELAPRIRKLQSQES